MKTVASLLSLLLMFAAGVSVFAAQPGATPQPRVRLQQSTAGVSTRIERVATPTAQPTPLMMQKVVVADSKLPTGPSTTPDPEPARFSPQRGGPIFSGRIGPFPVQVGVWPWRDIFADDAKLKPPRTRIDFEFVRIQW